MAKNHLRRFLPAMSKHIHIGAVITKITINAIIKAFSFLPLSFGAAVIFYDTSTFTNLAL